MRHVLSAVACLALITSSACTSADPTPSPEQVAADLRQANVAFSDSAARDNVADGLARMFAPDVRLVAGGRITGGRDSAAAVLRTNPENLALRARWRPLRVGISKDASQGFTIGYMEIVNAQDSVVSRAKYVAYWMRGIDGWRVAAYKRAPRSGGVLSTAMLAPSLPSGGAADEPESDPRASLRATELAFSDSGQRDVGAAFSYFAAPDANHTGGPDDVDFLQGKEAIGRGVGGGSAPSHSRIRWSPSETVVAASGDLGFNIGEIVTAEAGKPDAKFPFLSIWRRMRTGEWRFVAE
jgi:ketosteroid isomerase-like protein